MQVNQTREAWLTQASELLFSMTLNNVAQRANLTRHAFKISVGNCGAQKVIGQCWARTRSDSGINEIFIAPHIDDSAVILATLTHELIHALDDCQSGHKGAFATMARQADLQGKLTATTAGATLSAIIDDIVDAIGPIPHTRLDTTPVKKQTTRLKLMECPECGFRFRATQKHIDNIEFFGCLACLDGVLVLETK